MEVATPKGAPDAQDARTLCRFKIFHREVYLSRFSRDEPDFHTGGFFSDTGVMAAMAMMANMAAQGPEFDCEKLLNQSEFGHGVKINILHSPSDYRINFDQHCRTSWCCSIFHLLGLTQFSQFPPKAVTFDQGLWVDGAALLSC